MRRCSVLQVEDVSKRFGQVQALSRCTFTAAAGRLVGLLGPNGAGKTTLMRCLLGLVTPDSGTMRWQGAPLTPRIQRGFGYMPEERGLYPSMPVREQVQYFARLSGLSPAEASRAADAVIERVELTAQAERRIEQLSHGNQQRVQLAVALVHTPVLLVLDEPFSGLDPLGVDALADVLRMLTAEGAGVLFSSHQLDLVEHLCQDVVTLDHGRVVLAGPLDRLKAQATRRHVEIAFAGVPAPGWSDALPDAACRVLDERHVRIDLTRDADLPEVLRAAHAAGGLLRFDFEPPTLQELFREAVVR
jgi:ABC-2 type transport system ATP-binding protein